MKKSPNDHAVGGRKLGFMMAKKTLEGRIRRYFETYPFRRLRPSNTSNNGDRREHDVVSQRGAMEENAITLLGLAVLMKKIS